MNILMNLLRSLVYKAYVLGNAFCLMGTILPHHRQYYHTIHNIKLPTTLQASPYNHCFPLHFNLCIYFKSMKAIKQVDVYTTLFTAALLTIDKI